MSNETDKCLCPNGTPRTYTQEGDWEIAQCTCCGAADVQPYIPDEEDCEEDDLSDINPIDEEMGATDEVHIFYSICETNDKRKSS